MDLVKLAIDIMVFGKTDLNDDGTIDMTNDDIMEKLQEIQIEVSDFKEEIQNSLDELKEKLDDSLSGLEEIKDKIEELET